MTVFTLRLLNQPHGLIADRDLLAIIFCLIGLLALFLYF
jgi:hypothetical protein